MPFISEETAAVILDVIDFASDGTWPQLKDHLLEGSTPETIEKAGEEVSEASGRENPFEGEFCG